MLDLRLYLIQRITALIMAPLVLAHLALMIWAIQGGLTAAEILSRTAGSWGWAGFYGLFVLAAAVHGAIGLRVIALEWMGLRDGSARILMLGAGTLLLVMGLRAVMAVTWI